MANKQKNKAWMWITSLWYYIWFKPVYVLHKETRHDEDGEYQTQDNRWYVHKRILPWILVFPIFLIPLFLYGGLRAVYEYFVWLFTYYSRWVNLKKDIDFRTKLDIVRILLR